MNFLTELRKEREPLAITLQKHKGIRRILEDFYPDNAHFIYELLQNAEDADAQHAWFELHKGHLVFTHDGTRHFDEHDVSSITDIGDSSKREDAEKIGNFGVGFKSVFVYTETPRIYSKRFSFRITNLVLPEAISPKPEIGGKTRFEFPFNSPKKSEKDAFSEIKAGLETLSENTLLFLSNLRTISWHIENGSSGSLSRIEHPDNHIEIYKKSDPGIVSGIHWLRFTAPVDGIPEQNVAVAYQLNFLPKVKIFESKELLSKQMEITSSQGRVSVFFPAEKELSGLRFHLHAPFVPELSRASIKDTPANLPLFGQLANLAAKSLHTIRDLGLLTGDFLSVLPNPEDELPPRYAPIRQAIINEMQNEPLTPTHNKSHAPARQLVQAKAVLKDLISEKDLRYFLEGENEEPKWSIGARQKNSDQDRFLAGLGIRNWDVAEFVELLKEKATESEYSWGCKPDEKFLIWLGSKSDEWHQQMYSVLYQELKDDDFSQLRDVKIIRLSDRAYSVGRKCYFPTESVDCDDLMPRVARAVFSSGTKKIQAEAKKLLEGIGVKEIGESEEIERILKERYRQESDLPDDKTHLSDMRRFMKFVENNSNNPQCKKLFMQYFIFKTEDKEWERPEAVFLDSPYKETLLSAYYKGVPAPDKSKSALSSWYEKAGISIKRLNEFAEAVGVQISLYIKQTNCNNNPQRDYLYNAPGYRFTIYGENRDHTIPGLESLLNQQSIKISQLLWKTMCSAPTKALQAEYRNNIQAGSHYADSLLVHRLRQAEWVPQKGGIFVTPSHASRSQLPEGFPFDEGYEWLKAIGFGEDEKKQSEEFRQREKKRIELGFESEDALGRALEFAKLPEEEQQRILSEYKQRRDFELPENSVSNPQRRAQKLAEQAKDAPERVSEERTRSVSVGVEEVKARADQYLRQQYTNIDGQMICQVCKAELPFKKDNGDYYFERVELLADLPGRHRENYIILCPNHAAMFQHANGSKELLEPMLKELERTELEVVLAQRDMTVYFTETHITDLKAVISSVRRQEDNPEVRP